MKPDLIRLADYENRVKIITGSGKPLSDKVKLIGIEIKNLHTDIFERICRNCKKEYTESNAKSPEWHCSDVCEKTAAEKNYEEQIKYSTQGQHRASFESNRMPGKY